MLDSEKIELIRNLLSNYWESVNVSEDSALALINAITTVTDFCGKDE
jgi:hypothetical protein